MLADTASRSWPCCAGSIWASSMWPYRRVRGSRTSTATGSVSASCGTSWVSRSCSGRGSGTESSREPRLGGAVVAPASAGPRRGPVRSRPARAAPPRPASARPPVPRRRRGSPRRSARAPAPNRPTPAGSGRSRCARPRWSRPAPTTPPARATRPGARPEGPRPTLRRGRPGGRVLMPAPAPLLRCGLLRRCDEVVAGLLDEGDRSVEVAEQPEVPLAPLAPRRGRARRWTRRPTA